MGFLTIKIDSEKVGELVKATSTGKIHEQNIYFRCPDCRHPMRLEVKISEAQIIFRPEVLGSCQPAQPPVESNTDIFEEEVIVKEDKHQEEVFIIDEIEPEVEEEYEMDEYADESATQMTAESGDDEVQSVRRKRKNNQARPWECGICLKNFVEKRVLNKHQKDSVQCSKKIRENNLGETATIG